MRLSAVVVGGFLAAGLAAMPPANAASKPDEILEAVKMIPPIDFFVARGGPNACGPGCDSWIAAEGYIDADAAPHLRRLLEKFGSRKLPIYFNSMGGDLAQALTIGRMLRARDDRRRSTNAGGEVCSDENPRRVREVDPRQSGF